MFCLLFEIGDTFLDVFLLLISHVTPLWSGSISCAISTLLNGSSPVFLARHIYLVECSTSTWKEYALCHAVCRGLAVLVGAKGCGEEQTPRVLRASCPPARDSSHSGSVACTASRRHELSLRAFHVALIRSDGPGLLCVPDPLTSTPLPCILMSSSVPRGDIYMAPPSHSHSAIPTRVFVFKVGFSTGPG